MNNETRMNMLQRIPRRTLKQYNSIACFLTSICASLQQLLAEWKTENDMKYGSVNLWGSQGRNDVCTGG